jgi:hypothetical protein
MARAVNIPDGDAAPGEICRFFRFENYAQD